MTLKEWAEQNAYADVYAAYREECESIREYYGDHTDDAELAISQIQEHYPELFGDEEE